MLIVPPYHHRRLLWFAGTVSTITPVYSRYFARNDTASQTTENSIVPVFLCGTTTVDQIPNLIVSWSD